MSRSVSEACAGLTPASGDQLGICSHYPGPGYQPSQLGSDIGKKEMNPGGIQEVKLGVF